MKLDLKALVAKFLLYTEYIFSKKDTANTTATKVPVWNGNYLEYRTIPTIYNSSSLAASVLTGTIAGARLPVMFKTVSASTGTFSLAAGVGFDKTVTISVPSGYELVGCVGFSSNHSQLCFIGGAWKSSSTAIRITGRNSTTATSWTDLNVTVYALCALSNIY